MPVANSIFSLKDFYLAHLKHEESRLRPIAIHVHKLGCEICERDGMGVYELPICILL